MKAIIKPKNKNKRHKKKKKGIFSISDFIAGLTEFVIEALFELLN